MTISFNNSKGFTVGMELELQLIDKDTLALANLSDEVIAAVKAGPLARAAGDVKHELMKSNLEVVTGVCADLDQAHGELKEVIGRVIDGAATEGALISMAGTHPFSLAKDQVITAGPRYRRLVDTLQMVARRFNIFGMHIHVGVDGPERCIYVMNRILYYLPHILALSSNSPFWEGEDTGLRSYRTKVFETLPTAGLPFYFESWDTYTRLVESYIETGTIETIREIWWDVRPHPDFGTVELRICDTPSTIGEAVSIAALVQALVKKFSDEYHEEVPYKRLSSAVIRENKWRACRYGLDGELLTADGHSTFKLREGLLDLLEMVAPESEALGSTKYIEKLKYSIESDSGTGAARQLDVWADTGDFKEIVKAQVARLYAEVKGSE